MVRTRYHHQTKVIIKILVLMWVIRVVIETDVRKLLCPEFLE